MKTSRRTWLQRLTAAGAGIVALVPIFGRRSVAAVPSGPVTVDEVRGLTSTLRRCTGLQLADPATVLAESLRMSNAVAELNETCAKAGERGDFFWGYSSNHTVDSTPYYYSLWRCRRNGRGLSGAEFFFHGPFSKAIEQIEQFKAKRPELEVQGHTVQVVYGQEVTLIPKSAQDEHDTDEYAVVIGDRYLMIHANALMHKYSGEIKSYTRLYNMNDPQQEIQGGLNLMEVANSELSDEEAEGIKSIMQMVRGAKPAFPPPPPERLTQVITIHQAVRKPNGGIV